MPATGALTIHSMQSSCLCRLHDTECPTQRIGPCWQLQEVKLDLTAHELDWDLALLQQSWVGAG